MLANGNVPVQFQTLSGGWQGTDQTVALMQQLCTSQWGSRSPKIHALALNIVTQAGVAAKDYTGEMVAIHNWVRDNIRYTRDVSGQETLYPPEEVAFNSRAGDCLIGSTRLLTPKGFKAIRDIKVGDTIQGRKGWTLVTKWWDKGILPTRTYVLNNGGDFTATDDHRCFTQGGSEIRAGDLVEGTALLGPSPIEFNDNPARVESIKNAGDQHVYDVETTDHGIYLADADIVVHNCDDMSMLEAALLGSIGTTTRFVTIGVTPDRYGHVYLQAKPEESWIPLDPIMPKPAGWEVPPSKVKVKKVYDENVPQELSVNNLNGLGDSTADQSAAGGTPGGSRNSSPWGWYVGAQGGGFANSHLSPDYKPESDGQSPYIITDSMSDSDAPIEQLSINAPAFPQQTPGMPTNIGPAPLRNIAPQLQDRRVPIAQTGDAADPNVGQALAQAVGEPVQAYDTWNRPHVLMPDGSVTQPHWYTPSDGFPLVGCPDGSIVKPGALPPGGAAAAQLPDGSLVAPTFTAGPNPYAQPEADPNAGQAIASAINAPVQAYAPWARPHVVMPDGSLTQPHWFTPSNQMPVVSTPSGDLVQGTPIPTHQQQSIPLSDGTTAVPTFTAGPNPYAKMTGWDAGGPAPYTPMNGMGAYPTNTSVTAGPPYEINANTNITPQARAIATKRSRSKLTGRQVQQLVFNDESDASNHAAQNPGDGMNGVMSADELAGMGDSTGIDRQLPYASMQRPALAQAPEGIDNLFTRPNMVLRTDKGDTIVYKGLWDLAEKPPIRPYNPHLDGITASRWGSGVAGLGATGPSVSASGAPIGPVIAPATSTKPVIKPHTKLTSQFRSLNGVGMMPARSISGPGVADLADAAAAAPDSIPTMTSPSAPMAPTRKAEISLGAMALVGLGAYLLLKKRK